VLLGSFTLGCDGAKTTGNRRGKKTPMAESAGASRDARRPSNLRKTDGSTKRARPAESASARPDDTPSPAPSDPPPTPLGPPGPDRRRTLGDLLNEPVDSFSKMLPSLPRMDIDDAAAAAAGIHKLSGKRLTLYTDLPLTEAIRQSPDVFEQAFSLWCGYFDVDPIGRGDWGLTGFLMKDRALFRRLGLLPPEIPDFKHGFSRNHEFWLMEQPSDYYRRHLMLHEGTHSFMNTVLGACGPTWYMEGIAELLATHRWNDGRLTMNYFPASREEVRRWARIRMIQDAVAEWKGLPLTNVIEFSPSAMLETESYAWCWAVAALLDGHPRYQQRFRDLHRHVLQGDFTDRFYRAFHDDWDELAEEWQVFATGLEYGYDIAATVIDFTPGKPLPPSGADVTVVADKGWQNSGLQLEAGKTYQLRATGRYQVADQPQIWWCEPGGVSIRYYRGRPLGVLLAALRPAKPEASQGKLSTMVVPAVVGLESTLKPVQTGTLMLKINDSAAELGDNAGHLSVRIDEER
jgi:hypothetical protein